MCKLEHEYADKVLEFVDGDDNIDTDIIPDIDLSNSMPI